ncbi:MAG TPA: hypothetical protein ENH89_14865, partial [Aurantimonas coralicida]|nr:hypothetical protein [Aurantimonas coralicida]
ARIQQHRADRVGVAISGPDGRKPWARVARRAAEHELYVGDGRFRPETLILIVISLAFSLGLSRLSGLPLLDLLLAYSPGGLTETSLIALALHVEVAFVATHHIMRVFLVMTSAGLVFRVVDRFRRPH